MSLAEDACRISLPLVCQPPSPAKPFAYGDLVPLGFLLRALKVGDSPPRPFDALWKTCCATGGRDYCGPTTLTPSSPASTRRSSCKVSKTPPGWRRWRSSPTAGTVTYPSSARRDRHWCQPDYGTPCLVSALRAQSGLVRKTPVEHLEHSYEGRGGLFFANPYMVDWTLAQVLQGSASATDLRRRLATDVLASINEDGSFGRYDVPMSTALAILTLTALSAGEEAVQRARLTDFMMEDGRWHVPRRARPHTTPSSRRARRCSPDNRPDRLPSPLPLHGTHAVRRQLRLATL